MYLRLSFVYFSIKFVKKFCSKMINDFYVAISNSHPPLFVGCTPTKLKVPWLLWGVDYIYMHLSWETNPTDKKTTLVCWMHLCFSTKKKTEKPINLTLGKCQKPPQFLLCTIRESYCMILCIFHNSNGPNWKYPFHITFSSTCDVPDISIYY